MYTEDQIGEGLADGSIDVAEAVRIFQEEDVVVYPPVGVAEGTEMWADVEDMGAGSTIFADLSRAGATPEQMDEVGTQIVRLRQTGRTLDKVYGWSVEATTPEGTPETQMLVLEEDQAPPEGEPDQPV